jgi:hypothetical protein
MQDKEDVHTQSQREAKLSLAMASLQEVLMISIRTIPIEVKDATLNIQDFYSPQ